MNPADGTSAPNQQKLSTDGSTGVKAPEGMDLSAINEAIAASADEASKAPQQSFDVKDISLDNTPTTDAELKQQQEKTPDLNLANSGSATSATADSTTVAATTPATATPSASAAADKPAAPAASFIDGDIMDDAPAKEDEKPAEPNYDALNADPLESFDDKAVAEPASPAEVEAAPAADAPATDAPAEGEAAPAEGGDAKKDDKGKKDDKSKAKKEIKIDFDKIIHSNIAIICIVVGVIIIAVGAILIFTLNN